MVSEKKYTKLGSLKDYQDLVERLKKIPTMISQIIDLLKQGKREGVTYARESLGGVDAQFEKLQGNVEDSPFYVRFRDMPGSLGRHVVSRTKTEAFNITENQILPAFRRLQEFIKYEYSSALRSPPGVSSIPDGAEFYQATLNWHLGTDLSPQEVKLDIKHPLFSHPPSPTGSKYWLRGGGSHPGRSKSCYQEDGIQYDLQV